MSQDLTQWHDIADLIGKDCASILDIGCGDGRTLNLCSHVPVRAGVDVNSEAISMALKNMPDGDFRLSLAESLPFEDNMFDAIVICVALPYMDIPVVINECARVLKPSGKLFVSVHDWHFLQLLWKNTRPNLAGTVFRIYVAINGLSFHFLGKVFRYPLRPSMMESFQTEVALTRTLAAAGFNHVSNLNRPVPSFSAVLD